MAARAPVVVQCTRVTTSISERDVGWDTIKRLKNVSQVLPITIAQ